MGARHAEGRLLAHLAPADLSASARLAGADIPDEVASLKRRPGKDMVIFGGVETVQAFIRHGLIDEYWFKVHPVAIGAGRPVFPDLREQAKLALLQSRAYDSGIITLRYRTAGPPLPGGVGSLWEPRATRTILLERTFRYNSSVVRRGARRAG